MTQPIKPAIDALWALHIPGPEELYAQPSEAAANAAAQRHRQTNHHLAKRPPPAKSGFFCLWSNP